MYTLAIKFPLPVLTNYACVPDSPSNGLLPVLDGCFINISYLSNNESSMVPPNSFAPAQLIP